MEESADTINPKKSRPDYVASFISDFRSKKQCVEEKLNELEKIDSASKSVDFVNEILIDFENLKKLLGNSAHILPSYNVKMCQDSLYSMMERIEKMKNEIIPKEKFGFKRSKVSKKQSEVKKSEDVIDSCMSSSPELSLIEKSFIGFKNETDAKLYLQAENVSKKDVNLSNLVNCDVNIFGTPSTVHVNNVESCRINVGPVETSIFVADCKDSVFNLACQQLRIHTTVNSRFNIHVTSRCIIEDCKGLMFSELKQSNWTYDGIEDDFRKANLDLNLNNWNKVNDFNWLVADKPSPNWSIVSK